MNRSARKWLLCPLAALAVACGSATNFNQIWGGDDEAADSLVTKARVLYDQGEFDEARKLAEKAVEINPNNQDAAVVLGYIYLSSGGIDPFILARELIHLEDDKKKDGGNNLLQPGGGGPGGGGPGGGGPGGGGGGPGGGRPNGGDNGGDEQAPAEDEQDDGVTDTLKRLGDLVNLSDADYQILGQDYQAFAESSDEDEYELRTDLFKDNPLLVPAKPVEVRDRVEVLKYMNSAIMAVCRFVDPYAKIDESNRHSDASCAKVYTGQDNAKAHFLWAFAHLTEALVYQSVLLYTSKENAEAKSNFQAAANDLDNFQGDFSAFSLAILDMKNAVDAVFDTSDTESMITETLFALDSVNKAFAVLTGLPKKMVERISKIMDGIREVGKTIGDTDDVTSNTQALKGKMTEKFSKTVADKIDGAVQKKLEDDGLGDLESINKDELPDAVRESLENQVTEVCTAYDSLVAGVDEKQRKTPLACEKFKK